MDECDESCPRRVICADRRSVAGSWVSLSLAAGEAVALLGASGSGKSLTAAALTGSLPGGSQTSGQLNVSGRDISLATKHRPGIASVRQDSLTALHPLVRIDRQLIPVILRSGGAPTRSAAGSLAVSLLEDVGFANPDRVLGSFPMELSGGQRQRVCIVQSLACRSSFLIADEPTTALDVISQHHVLSALRKAIGEGAGVLLITHDVAAAASLCSRAIVISGGSIVDEGSFEYLAAADRHPEVTHLMGAAQRTVRRGGTAVA
ncbi:ATP-binding cassette domain-containing protein [Arthrobacter sp. CAN_A212]|uniref:ATP-binding cassette domain-containing protein n=1 Tax=Arthrobacter sp. CAN_A212 TaxID=2787719 RepID=UPI002FF25E13